MPRLSAVGISGIHAGEDVKLEQLASALLEEIKRRYGSLEIIQAYSPWDKR